MISNVIIEIRGISLIMAVDGFALFSKSGTGRTSLKIYFTDVLRCLMPKHMELFSHCI